METVWFGVGVSGTPWLTMWREVTIRSTFVLESMASGKTIVPLPCELIPSELLKNTGFQKFIEKKVLKYPHCCLLIHPIFFLTLPSCPLPDSCGPLNDGCPGQLAWILPPRQGLLILVIARWEMKGSLELLIYHKTTSSARCPPPLVTPQRTKGVDSRGQPSSWHLYLHQGPVFQACPVLHRNNLATGRFLSTHTHTIR